MIVANSTSWSLARRNRSMWRNPSIRIASIPGITSLTTDARPEHTPGQSHRITVAAGMCAEPWIAVDLLHRGNLSLGARNGREHCPKSWKDLLRLDIHRPDHSPPYTERRLDKLRKFLVQRTAESRCGQQRDLFHERRVSIRGGVGRCGEQVESGRSSAIESGACRFA